MIGAPDLTETTIAPQFAAHLTAAQWEKVPLPTPASQLIDFSAEPTDPESLLVCGFSSLEKSTIQGEITPRGPIATWLTHDAGMTWTQSRSPAMSGTDRWMGRSPDDAQRLTLMVHHPAPVNPRCSEDDLPLSDDNGAS